MSRYKLILYSKALNIYEEISGNLLAEAIKGLPENSDQLKQMLKLWLEGENSENISIQDLNYVENELANIHHMSENRLGLVGRIPAEDYETIVGGESTENVQSIQSGIVLSLAIRRFRMLCGLKFKIHRVKEDVYNGDMPYY